jgi:hypothetical protein
MKSGLLIASAILLFGLHAPAQHLSMDDWLNYGTDKERIQKLVELGVPLDMSRLTVDSDSSIDWLSLRSAGSSRQAILSLGCNGLAGAAIYLADKVSGKWRVVDHLGLDCHYDNSTSVELASIKDQASDEVLVHHDCIGRGTDYLEQHFYVLAVQGDRFRKELETIDVLHDDPVPLGTKVLEQHSTFTEVPIDGSNQRAIEETRTSILNGALRVERRYFRWSPATGRYEPSKFTAVTATAN